jgi:hypothetical protein
MTVKRKNNDYDSKLERWIGKQKKDILKHRSSPGSTYLDDICIQQLTDIGVTSTVDRVSHIPQPFQEVYQEQLLEVEAAWQANVPSEKGKNNNEPPDIISTSAASASVSSATG